MAKGGQCARRFVLGEGLEKRSSDLAAEVAEQKEAFEAAAASRAAAAAEATAPAVEEACTEAKPAVEVRLLQNVTAYKIFECRLFAKCLKSPPLHLLTPFECPQLDPIP